jgi:hypothetical protein
MIDGMERERAFKQVGAIDLNRSEPDGRFAGGSVNRSYHLFCVVGFDAVGFQVCAKLREMLVVPRFNGAEHIDG